MIEKCFELKFAGGDVRPQNARLSELAVLLKEFEDSILETMKEIDPSVDLNDFVIGLTEVEEGSLVLRFLPKTCRTLFYSSLTVLTMAATQRDLSSLNEKSRTFLRGVQRFSREHQCEAQFASYRSGDRSVEALIDFETEFRRTDHKYISGGTSFQAYVLRAGGKEPKVRVTLMNGMEQSFTTSEEVVQRIGSCIYKWVTLRGIAKWNPLTMHMEDFDILDFQAEESDDVVQSFAELSDKYGKYFDNFDPDEYYAARNLD